jgi:hypothetical protein
MNLIFTAFATLEGYREGSNANLGSEVFYRCIVVSLVSAKQKNQNCDAALVTNTAVPEPYAAQLSQAGIRVIACPFDNYRFEADLDWSLAYYKLCAMQYLLETEHYENYLMLDSDTFTQRGYQDIWREAAEAAYDAEVDTAREEERIGADEVPGFKALMRKDPENTRTLLAARKPKRRIMQTLASATGAEGKTDKDYLAEREAEVRARLKQ